MNKPFGFRGYLSPQHPFKGLENNLTFGSIEITIKNGIFEVGYDKEDEKDKALSISYSLISSWSKRNNIKIVVDFNQTWKTKIGHKHIGIKLSESMKVVDRVVTTSTIIKVIAYIVKPHTDSYSFTNDVETAKKAAKDKTLALVLKYFHEEVIDNKKPFYGIHKAVEQLIKHQPGKNENEKRNKLAALSGYTRSYIDDLMTSIQTERHSHEWLRLNKIGKIISDQECFNRASSLIDSYIAALPL